MAFIGWPSPLFGVRAALNAFCEAMSVQQRFAGSIAKLEELYHFKLTYSDGMDVDDTGLLQKYALAAYMKLDASRVKEWIAPMDNYIAWRASGEYHGDNGVKTDKPGLAIHNLAGLKADDISLETSHCPIEELADSSQCPVSITDVPPPVYPKRFAIMKIEFGATSLVDIVISGNCKPFAPGLASKRIPCKALKKDPADEYAEKFYTLFDLDVAAAENVKLVVDSLLDEVFVGSPVVVRMPNEPGEGPAKDFVKQLKGCTSLVWR